VLPAAAAALALGLTAAACGTSPAASSDSYGSLPGFLPKSSLRPDGVLVGSAQRPALTSEGDSVEVRLPRASVLATVVGPEVPGEGLPYRTPATTCTWIVRLSRASGRVRIRIADFTTLDHLGAIYHLTLVPGHPAPPVSIVPGRTVRFELRAVMATGEGVMRWAPGGKITAMWDFVVEND
jgi:hypothetical protein